MDNQSQILSSPQGETSIRRVVYTKTKDE